MSKTIAVEKDGEVKAPGDSNESVDNIQTESTTSK